MNGEEKKKRYFVVLFYYFRFRSSEERKMSDSYRNLCLKIVERPSNDLIGQLTDLLNENASLNHDEIFDRCGKYLSGINLDECLKILIEKQNENLIEKYLRLIDDIPEKQFIFILNFNLKYLEILLEKRYDYWSLCHSMKIHLNSSLTVDLADRLALILTDKTHRLTSTILDWFCALIDAHYSAFVLAKWKNLSLVDDYLQQRLNTFDQLQTIKSISSSTFSSSTNSTSTSNSNQQKKNHLYVLQRIHFK